MEGRSCDLELLRSALIGSEMVSTNSFQKTLWEISLRLNGIYTCDYPEMWNDAISVFSRTW